jgi:hypothetical protein
MSGLQKTTSTSVNQSSVQPAKSEQDFGAALKNESSIYADYAQRASTPAINEINRTLDAMDAESSRRSTEETPYALEALRNPAIAPMVQNLPRLSVEFDGTSTKASIENLSDALHEVDRAVTDLYPDSSDLSDYSFPSVSLDQSRQTTELPVNAGLPAINRLEWSLNLLSDLEEAANGNFEPIWDANSSSTLTERINQIALLAKESAQEGRTDISSNRMMSGDAY